MSELVSECVREGHPSQGHLYHVCSDTYGDGHLAGYDLREGADFLEEPVQTGGHQLHEHPNLTLPGEGRGGEGRGGEGGRGGGRGDE